MEHLKGIELLYTLSKDQIKSRDDCLVLVLHCLLINEDFLCMGQGDEWPSDISNKGSELLPEGWNQTPNTYSLRYVNENGTHRYLLKIVKSGNSLLVNLVKDSKTANAIAVNVDSYVTEDFKSFQKAYKDIKNLITLFSNEVLKSLRSDTPGNSQDTPKQSQQEHPPENPEPILPERSQPNLIPNIPSRAPPPRFPEVGGADLNPFSGGYGGGMLFDPRGLGGGRPPFPQFGIGGPRGLPRSAVPPGARFDPFRPPLPGMGSGPSPDHLPPPNYEFYF